MKRVILVRHGESAAQKFSKQQRWDVTRDELRDPYLSAEGMRQASELGTFWTELGPPPPLVISSPLSRAVQTASLLFPAKRNIQIIIHPNLRETSPGGNGSVGKPAQQECRGRLVQDLKGDSKLSSGNVDWSLVPEGSWWSNFVESPDAVQSRLCAFCDWLEQRPESAAVIVCHFNIIQRLLAVRGFKVQNCTPVFCIAMGREWRRLEEPSMSPVVFWRSMDEDPLYDKQGSSVPSPIQQLESVASSCDTTSHVAQMGLDICTGVAAGKTNKCSIRRWGRTTRKEEVDKEETQAALRTCAPTSQSAAVSGQSLNGHLPYEEAPESLFDCFAVLDFEATCEDGCDVEPQEIIEFPIVLVHATSGKILSEFRTYVRPVHHPLLTRFCIQLTGITQAKIDAAPAWSDALNYAQTWLDSQLQELDVHSCICVTCGDWDLRSMMGRQCALAGMHVPQRFKQWLNIKNLFKKVTGKSGGGMTAMLQILGLRLEGHHHSGLDDSRNIARILIELLRKGGSVAMDMISTTSQGAQGSDKGRGKGGKSKQKGGV